MAALIKSVLFLSVFVLLGSGFVPRFIYRTHWSAGFLRILQRGTLFSALLLLLATAADLAATVQGVLGFLDQELLLRYLTSTDHGRWSQVRAGAAVLLVLLDFVPWLRPRAADQDPRGRATAGGVAGNSLFLLAGLLLLFTFSRISHNAAMGGVLPLPADLIHLSASVSWGSALLFLAFLPVWNELSRPALEQSVQRLSRLGLVAVALLFASGIYSGFLHISTLGGLTGTGYGQSLILKVLLVLLITGLAAVNKLLFVPRLLHYGPSRPLRLVMQGEAVLLLAVLFMTGILTTSPMPH
jgi:putative copper resistance protein D